MVIVAAAGGGFYLNKTKTQAATSPYANSAVPASSDAAAQAQRMLMNKMMGQNQR